MKHFVFLFLLPSLVYGFDVFQGEDKYEITEISSQLSEQYGVDFRVSSIVIASNNKESNKFRKQWSIVESIDAEQYQLIYVNAVSEGRLNSHGYYTTEKVAEELLSGNNFLVLLYSPEGRVLVSSNEVLSREAIVEHVSKP